jgi:hypothetical protein
MNICVLTCFTLHQLTWQAGTFIIGVQHMATAIVLAGITLTEMGAELCLTVDTCHKPDIQPALTRKSPYTKCGYFHRSKTLAFFIMCKDVNGETHLNVLCFKCCENTKNAISDFQVIISSCKTQSNMNLKDVSYTVIIVW